MNLTLNLSWKMKLMALALGLLVGLAVCNVTNRSAQGASAKPDGAASHEPMPSLQGQPAIDYLKQHGLFDNIKTAVEANSYKIQWRCCQPCKTA